MKNLVGSILTVTFVLLLAFQTRAFAQPKYRNAAVQYLRADVALHQAYPLPPQAWVKLEQALEGPLSAEDEKLVAAASEALTEFQHGAESKLCDWQMSAEDGPFANTSHRGAVMELVAVSALRARVRLRDGDHKGAIADLLAAYAAARHLSLDGSIASVLIGYKLEREVTAALQNAIALLTPPELEALESGLAGLPQGSSMQNAITAEKLNRDDLTGIIGDAHTHDELVSRMAAGIPSLANDRAKTQELVDGCGGSLAGVMNCIDKQRAFYEKWMANFGLPPETFQQQFDPDYARASTGNPILERFTPMLSRFRWAEAYNDTRRALLHAAVAVQRDGTKELSRYPDPSNGRPFSYTQLANGFVLESALKENGKPISLSVVSTQNK
ncbi:MAG: hypothetical protein LAO76_08990 [Acidobacteriia bacterium]|nr:hypothetical protein [Terriglobia bacterium]